MPSYRSHRGTAALTVLSVLLFTACIVLLALAIRQNVDRGEASAGDYVQYATVSSVLLVVLILCGLGYDHSARTRDVIASLQREASGG